MNERIIRELREEIETLRQQLGQMGHRSSTQPLSEEEVRKMKEMEAVISTLEHAKLQVRGAIGVRVCAARREA